MRKIAAICLLLFSGLCFSQAYPSRPIRLIVPFPPGGSNDIVARMLATQLGEKLGQSVVIENKGGAGGVVGTEMVAKSAPDGYTLLLISIAYAFGPSLYKTLPYDPEKSFAPITIVGRGPSALVVHPSVPVNTVQELIALAKAQPGKLNYASAGIGSFQHLSCALLVSQAGIDVVHVPYKGGGPAMTDLMAGHVDLLFASVLEGSGHIKAGKLKGLAVTHAKRSPAIPDVPTLAEAGVRDAESGSWIALLAPAATPSSIVDKVAADVKEAVSAQDVREKLIAQGAVPQSSTPGELQALIDKDRERYGRIIREKGLKAE
jgi:tripartite-type tricarboxylate transporter receptor subunit TctC